MSTINTRINQISKDLIKKKEKLNDSYIINLGVYGYNNY